MRRAARTLGTFLALLILTGLQAFAQNPPPTRPPGGLALGGYNGAVKTATATAGAATLSSLGGVITSEALVTAAGATYTLTLTDAQIAAADQVLASVAYGTASTGSPVVTRVQPASGSVVIVVQNISAATALNGTIKISFGVLKN
jgi:hypothetical protein